MDTEEEKIKFNKIFETLRGAMRTFSGSSRYDRILFAQKISGEVRDYVCLKENIDPKTVDLAFAVVGETFDGNTIKLDNGTYKIFFSLGNIFRVNTIPVDFVTTCFHEMKHVVDDAKGRIDLSSQYLDDEGTLTARLKNRYLLTSDWLYYKTSLGWEGEKMEVMADTFAYKNTNRLIKMINELDKEKCSDEECKVYTKYNNQMIRKHYLPRAVLPIVKAGNFVLGRGVYEDDWGENSNEGEGDVTPQVNEKMTASDKKIRNAKLLSLGTSLDYFVPLTDSVVDSIMEDNKEQLKDASCYNPHFDVEDKTKEEIEDIEFDYMDSLTEQNDEVLNTFIDGETRYLKNEFLSNMFVGEEDYDPQPEHINLDE